MKMKWKDMETWLPDLDNKIRTIWDSIIKKWTKYPKARGILWCIIRPKSPQGTWNGDLVAVQST